MIENSHSVFESHKIWIIWIFVRSFQVLLEEGKLQKDFIWSVKGCRDCFSMAKERYYFFNSFRRDLSPLSIYRACINARRVFYLENIEPTELTAIRERIFNLINNNLSVRQLYEEKLIDFMLYNNCSCQE